MDAVTPLNIGPADYTFQTPFARQRRYSWHRYMCCFCSVGGCFLRKLTLENDIRGCDVKGCYGFGLSIPHRVNALRSTRQMLTLLPQEGGVFGATPNFELEMWAFRTKPVRHWWLSILILNMCKEKYTEKTPKKTQKDKTIYPKINNKEKWKVWV